MRVRAYPLLRGDHTHGDRTPIGLAPLRQTGLPGQGVGIELSDGRMMQVDIGDRLLGAFGVRFATLEATGTWEAIGPDGRMTRL